MPRCIRFLLLGVVVLALAGLVRAGDGGPSLSTAHGVVDKASKNSLVVLPRTEEGRFGKKLVLKVTGTSKISTLSRQKRDGKMVFVQRDAEAGDLQAKQSIAVIYASTKDGPVLLTAVVLPSGK
jgi:hypothetical protein